MFQKSVNTFSAPGIPGDFYDNSPRRVQPAVLNAGTDDVQPEVGKPFFYLNAATDPMQVATGAAAAAAGSFAGILVNGKELVRANGLTAGLTVAPGTVGSLCTMGRVWVKVSNSTTVGNNIFYMSATGLYQASANDTVSGGILIGKAVIVNAAADEMAVVELG